MSEMVGLSDVDKSKYIIQEPVNELGEFQLPMSQELKSQNKKLRRSKDDGEFSFGLITAGSITSLYSVSGAFIEPDLVPVIFATLGTLGLGLIIPVKNKIADSRMRKVDKLNIRYLQAWLFSSHDVVISDETATNVVQAIDTGVASIKVVDYSVTLVKANHENNTYVVKRLVTKQASKFLQTSVEKGSAVHKSYLAAETKVFDKLSNAIYGDFTTQRIDLCTSINYHHGEAVKAFRVFKDENVNTGPFREELDRIQKRTQELHVLVVTEAWQYNSILNELKKLKKSAKWARNAIRNASYRQVDELNRKLARAEQDLVARQPSTRQSSLALSKESHV